MPTYSQQPGTSFGLPEGYTPVPDPTVRAPQRYNYQGANAIPGGMEQLYAELEQQYGLPRGWGAQTAFVESSGNPNARAGSYQGLFQLGPGEAATYGVTNRLDPISSARGAAAYAAANLRQLPEGNRTAFDAYMAHQQGAAGYGQLLGFAPETRISDLPAARARKIVSQNIAGINNNATLGEYLTEMRNRFNTSPSGEAWGDWNAQAPLPAGGFGQRQLGPLPPGEPAAPASPRISPDLQFQDDYNINKTMGGFAGLRANGADVAGIDLSGIAFDRSGNPLGNLGISRDWQEGLREMQEQYSQDQGNLTANSADFAGRYAYGGDIRPQDALFLSENPGATVTREGRYVLPLEYAAATLNLGSPQDYAGRYDTPGPMSIEDALFLQQNPSFTLARGGANTGYGYRQDPTTGSYVPNTTGAGTAQPPGNFTPNPAPNTGALGNTAPSAADINGFPSTQYQPTPVPDVSTNPAAIASTIPGATQGVNPDWQVPSFGNPAYPGGVFGALPLGSSGVSPSTVGPGGIANPYPGDPNYNPGTGGGGSISIRPIYPGQPGFDY